MSRINFNSIMNQIQAAQKAANTANEQRYQQLLGTISGLQTTNNGTYNQILQSLAGTGAAERTQLARSTAKRKGSALQSLISRGLGNTTIRNAVLNSIGQNQQFGLQQIAGQQARQKASALQSQAASNQSITAMQANAIQSRNDVGPNLSMYASLLQQASQAQAMQKQLQASVPASNYALNGGGGFGGAGGSGGGGQSSFGETGGTGSPNGSAYLIGNPHGGNVTTPGQNTSVSSWNPIQSGASVLPAPSTTALSGGADAGSASAQLAYNKKHSYLNWFSPSTA